MAPAVVLWTDEKREWEALVPRFRQALPNFFIFGPYNAANRAGPAIWLRCVMAGKVAEISWPPTAVPILCLPGVSRATLRATEECRNELKPLAELQYRGVFWSQVNGKDWTVASFLQTNNGGLKLKLARDAATSTSIRRSLDKLADVPVAELKARSAAGELNSSFFDSLISDDPIDDLLSWMSDPRALTTAGSRAAGRRCAAGARRITTSTPSATASWPGRTPGNAGDKASWKTAWKRFAAVPGRYPGLLELLRKANPKAKPGDLLGTVRSEHWPQDNALLAGLETVGDRNPREHEFSIQLRAFDTSKTGSSLGVAALLAICSALINKSLRGGMVVLCGINLGGSIDPLHNAIDVVELAVEKGASVVLMPVSSRKQLFDLSDDIATKVTVVFYNDAREALIKAISD